MMKKLPLTFISVILMLHLFPDDIGTEVFCYTYYMSQMGIIIPFIFFLLYMVPVFSFQNTLFPRQGETFRLLQLTERYEEKRE